MDTVSGELLHWYFQQWKSTQFANPKTGEKILRFLTAFNEKGGANKRLLQTMAFSGVPADLSGLRSLVWKVLLGYLSCDPRNWAETLSAHRRLYSEYIETYVTEPQLLTADQRDHPLSLSPDSRWKTYAPDLKIKREIQNDIRRTRPETQNRAKSIEEPSFDSVILPQTLSSADTLTRVLFIYAKLHPEISYVQGMNELLAPIYFLFSQDRNPAFCEEVESDTFFCFQILMAEVQNSFNRSMDGSEGGIKTQLERLNSLLHTHDQQLWSHLERLNVKPQYYSMRWIMLLLTQDFQLSSVFRLWDSFLSDPMRFQYFFYVCLAMLVRIRNVLLACDFAQAVTVLQKSMDWDVTGLLKLANKLIMRDSSKRS